MLVSAVRLSGGASHVERAQHCIGVTGVEVDDPDSLTDPSTVVAGRGSDGARADGTYPKEFVVHRVCGYRPL